MTSEKPITGNSPNHVVIAHCAETGTHTFMATIGDPKRQIHLLGASCPLTRSTSFTGMVNLKFLLTLLVQLLPAGKG